MAPVSKRGPHVPRRRVAPLSPLLFVKLLVNGRLRGTPAAPLDNDGRPPGALGVRVGGGACPPALPPPGPASAFGPTTTRQSASPHFLRKYPRLKDAPLASDSQEVRTRGVRGRGVLRSSHVRSFKKFAACNVPWPFVTAHSAARWLSLRRRPVAAKHSRGPGPPLWACRCPIFGRTRPDRAARSS